MDSSELSSVLNMINCRKALRFEVHRQLEKYKDKAILA